MTDEQKIAKMRAVLERFSAKATKWEGNHPSFNRFPASDTVQIQHRLGDFRDARDVLKEIDAAIEPEPVSAVQGVRPLILKGKPPRHEVEQSNGTWLPCGGQKVCKWCIQEKETSDGNR